MTRSTPTTVLAGVRPARQSDSNREHPELSRVVNDLRRRFVSCSKLYRKNRLMWTPAERAILISLVAIVMGSLFVTTYSLT